MNVEYFLLGITVSLSLMLEIGVQNVFVIEQGLKRNYIFLVCLICAMADFLLIFLGIFIFGKTKDKTVLIENMRRMIRSSIGNRAKESLLVEFINQMDYSYSIYY